MVGLAEHFAATQTRVNAIERLLVAKDVCTAAELDVLRRTAIPEPDSAQILGMARWLRDFLTEEAVRLRDLSMMLPDVDVVRIVGEKHEDVARPKRQRQSKRRKARR
jgi:hypothetical protein